jgi:hypothetical protein
MLLIQQGNKEQLICKKLNSIYQATPDECWAFREENVSWATLSS